MTFTLLDRYFGRRILGTYVRVLVALVLIVIVVDLLTARQREIAKHEVPVGIVIEYYLTFIPAILFRYQAAAIGMLVTGLIVLGKAAQDNEITAALAGGISLHRLMRAPVLIAGALTLLVFLVSDTAGVAAQRRFDALQGTYFKRFEGGARPGVSWRNLSGEWTAHILKFNRRALTGEDVILHRSGGDQFEEIKARRIWWDESAGRWQLEDGRWSVFNTKEAWQQQVTRITQQPAPFIETPEELFALDEPADAKRAGELRNDLIRAELLGLPARQHWVEFHAKFAQPALCFIMIWLAAPFAIRLRRGGIAISFGVAIALGLAYILVYFIGLGLGRLDLLPPIAAAWVANLLFAGLAARLYLRTPT